MDAGASASAQVEVTRWLRPYAEVWLRGDPQRPRTGLVVFDGGLVLPLGPTVAIDIAGRADLAASTRGYGLLAGATFVVDGSRKARGRGE